MGPTSRMRRPSTTPATSCGLRRQYASARAEPRSLAEPRAVMLVGEADRRAHQGLAVNDARVEQRVHQVDQQGGQCDGQDRDEHDAVDDEVIRGRDGLEQQVADTRDSRKRSPR